MIILEKNNKLDRNDDNTVLFDNFFNRLQDRNNTEEDWNILQTKCSIGHASWVSCSFENNDTMHLFIINKEVLSHNHRKIIDV